MPSFSATSACVAMAPTGIGIRDLKIPIASYLPGWGVTRGAPVRQEGPARAAPSAPTRTHRTGSSAAMLMPTTHTRPPPRAAYGPLAPAMFETTEPHKRKARERATRAGTARPSRGHWHATPTGPTGWLLTPAGTQPGHPPKGRGLGRFRHAVKPTTPPPFLKGVGIQPNAGARMASEHTLTGTQSGSRAGCGQGNGPERPSAPAPRSPHRSESACRGARSRKTNRTGATARPCRRICPCP